MWQPLDPESALQRRELHECLRVALQRLEPRKRTLLMLWCGIGCAEMTHAAIAELEGIAEGTVKDYCARACSTIRRPVNRALWEAAGVTPPRWWW